MQAGGGIQRHDEAVPVGTTGIGIPAAVMMSILSQASQKRRIKGDYYSGRFRRALGAIQQRVWQVRSSERKLAA